jgi:hypothetical protein
MLIEKFLFNLIIYTSVLFFSDIIDGLFPGHIFSFKAFLYPMIANSFSAIIQLWINVKNHTEKVSGVEPFTNKEIVLKLATPFVAASFNFMLYAFISASNFVGGRFMMLQNKEGIILMGLFVGFFFDYFMMNRNLKLVSNAGTGLLKIWLKRLTSDKNES